MKFFKGVLLSDLKPDYIPGTVTTEFMIALSWKEVIQSNKSKGKARHVRHGEAVVIEIEYSSHLAHHAFFQSAGYPEHQRTNCWTSAAQNKAQINTPCSYRILTEQEIDMLFTF
jgi:hypothetical protein